MVAQVKLLVEIMEHVARLDEFDDRQRILVVGRRRQAKKRYIEGRRSRVLLIDDERGFALIAITGDGKLVIGHNDERNHEHDEKQDSIGTKIGHVACRR